MMEELKKAVEIELREDCREEALKILELSDDKYREDFLEYHKKDQGNVCCLVLDYAKKKLIEDGKWEYNPDDYFNDPYSDDCFNDPFKPFEEAKREIRKEIDGENN